MQKKKYSNDVRSDLDMKAILPISLAALNETSVPPPSPPLPLPPPASTVNNGEDQEADTSDDESDDE
jgi:hypothetical protein